MQKDARIPSALTATGARYLYLRVPAGIHYHLRAPAWICLVLVLPRLAWAGTLRYIHSQPHRSSSAIRPVHPTLPAGIRRGRVAHNSTVHHAAWWFPSNTCTLWTWDIHFVIRIRDACARHSSLVQLKFSWLRLSVRRWLHTAVMRLRLLSRQSVPLRTASRTASRSRVYGPAYTPKAAMMTQPCSPKSLQRPWLRTHPVPPPFTYPHLSRTQRRRRW